MSDVLKTSLALEEIAESLRQAGYRASIAVQNGKPVIQSAAQGLGFVIVPGNALPTDPQRFNDYSFNCLIRIEGELRPGLIDRWNESRRFARLYRSRDVLVLAYDVIAAGGVTERFLVTQCELWDRLIHDFIAYLRQSTAATASAAVLPAPTTATPPRAAATPTTAPAPRPVTSPAASPAAGAVTTTAPKRVNA
jgi:hypothetical protein